MSQATDQAICEIRTDQPPCCWRSPTSAKGQRAVRLVCELHRAAGVVADVGPRSGSAAGFKGDVRIHLLDGDPLVVKQGREPPLVAGVRYHRHGSRLQRFPPSDRRQRTGEE